jgi:hypothetical protein
MRLRPGNPMGRAMMIALIFEMIVYGLAIPVMVNLAGVPLSTAGLAVGLTAALCLVAAGAFRTPLGYPLGWLGQVAGLALGFLSSIMFVVAGIFVAIWVLAFVLGKKIDRAAPAESVRS